MRKFATEKRVSHPRLLGHVIAHELGHLLLDSAEHPARGLMRGRWQDNDLRLAAAGALQFTRLEMRTIRATVRVRPVEKSMLLALVGFMPR